MDCKFNDGGWCSLGYVEINEKGECTEYEPNTIRSKGEPRKYEVRVAGYKNWRIVPPTQTRWWGEVRGKGVVEDIIVEAETPEKAVILAIEEFRKKGYLFDHVKWVIPKEERDGRG